MRVKEASFDFIANADFLKRKGISFYWGGPLFTGIDFGTRTGPMNCVFTGTLHDIGHCIDFAQRKKMRQVTPSGLRFQMKWQKWNRHFGCYDGFPASAQHIHCEARAFAIQAWLMKKIAGGFYVSELDGQGGLEKSVYLTREVSEEEWIAEQGDLIRWFDTYPFLQEEGIEDLDYKAREKELEKRFSNLITRYYNEISERDITKAWTEVAAKIRYNQKCPAESKLVLYSERELIKAF